MSKSAHNPNLIDLSGNTLEETVALLASPHRRPAAIRQLMAAEKSATPVARRA
ncbi:MAG: hypothetical protein VB933_10165 [Pseudomonadales bacterium]